MGVATCEFANTDADTFAITATAQNDEVGKCVVYKTQASTADIHVEGQLVSITGNQGNYAGGGAYFSQGTTSIAEYHAQTWWPVIGSMRIKTDVGGAAELGQVGASGTSLSRYFAHEYDDAATDIIRGGEGTNGSTWTQVGASVTKTLTFDVNYGFWCQSYSTSASSGCNFDNAATSNTLETIGTPPPDPTSDTPDYNDLSETQLGGRTTTAVTTATFDALYAAAACGTDLVAAAGNYTGKTLNKTCALNNLLRIVGNGSAGTWTTDVTGVWTVSGNTMVTGMDFSATGSQIWLGPNAKLIGNRFHGWTNVAAVVPTGDRAEIAYNEFYSPGAYGAYGSLRMGIRTAENSTLANLPLNVWVHDNYVHTFPVKADPNDYSSSQDDFLEVCVSNVGPNVPTKTTGWYVERNLIERHLQGHGTIDFKCPGIARYNTFMNTPGRIDQRGPTTTGSTFESNWFEGGGGMTLHGDNNRVIGNVGGTITLNAGDIESTTAATNGSQHARVTDAVVAGNTGTLRVGLKGNAAATLHATRTLIEQHTGTITTTGTNYLSSVTTDNSGSATTINFVPAFSFDAGCDPLNPTVCVSTEVGPGGLSGASADYKAKRGF